MPSLADLGIEVGNLSWPSLYNPLVDLGRAKYGPVSPGGKYLSGAGEIFTFTLYWTLVLHVPLYAVLGICACTNVLAPGTPRRTAGHAVSGNGTNEGVRMASGTGTVMATSSTRTVGTGQGSGSSSRNIVRRFGTTIGRNGRRGESENENKGKSDDAMPLGDLLPASRSSSALLDAIARVPATPPVPVAAAVDTIPPTPPAPGPGMLSSTPHSHQHRHQRSTPGYNRRTRLVVALVVLASFLAAGVANAVLGATVLGFVLARVYAVAGFWMSTWVPFIWAVIHSLVSFLGVWPSVVDII